MKIRVGCLDVWKGFLGQVKLIYLKNIFFRARFEFINFFLLERAAKGKVLGFFFKSNLME